MFAVAFRLGLAGLLFAALTSVHAQYKVVGPDGKVTYTDQAPTASARAPGVAAPADRGSDAQTLPANLRQVVGRYPVTLYAGKNCSPCDSGRQLLLSRGIPFTEKRVDSQADIAAFMALTGNGTIPALTIGQQRLKGWVSSEWVSYLDAAGYPKTSVLPANYRNPEPSPLANPVTLAPSPAPTRPAVPEPERNTPANPPGTPNIRF
jgi:glutaredoxin